MKMLNLRAENLHRAQSIAARTGEPLDIVIEAAVSIGLDELERRRQLPKPFCIEPLAMGIQPGISLDNIQELICQVEGEDAR